VSKEDGNDESYSIANQRSLLESYIADHDDLKLVKFYMDDGISGTNEEERPGYQQLLADVKSGAIQCVLVKDLSRPFRNSADQTRFLEETRVRYGVRFISTRLPYVDTVKNPETLNMLSIGFQGMMNENHCRETSLKVRDVLDSKRRNGKFIGAFAPYGYAKHPQDKNRLVIDEDTAGVVRDVYRWFCGGMSKAGITQKLNKLGIPSPAAYKRQIGLLYHNPHDKFASTLWQPRTVYNILSSQMYIGHMVQGKQKVKSYKVHERVSIPQDKWFIVKNTHAPIVDDALFDMAQDLMKRDTRAAPNQRGPHLFAGFVRCADCGKAMHRKTAKTIVYYFCRTYTQQSKSGCTKHSIREDALYNTVYEAVQMQIKLADSLTAIVNKISEAPRAHTESTRLDTVLKQHRGQLERKRSHVKALYTDMKDGLLSRNEYLDFKREFSQEITSLEKQIEKLEEERETAKEGAEADHPYIAHFQRLRELKALDRQILTELVDVILIHDSGAMEIKFKLADQYQRVIGCIESDHGNLARIEPGTP
jgi:DNA invertase Pin-like site-specific DNA recombinase